MVKYSICEEKTFREPAIVATSFSLFVIYRVIHCFLKKNTTAVLAQNLSGDTRQPRMESNTGKIAEC